MLCALCFVQWLPRDGVATPAQIITAVQEGASCHSGFGQRNV